MTKKVRVRYAPSPTGFLHIGNTRTALMNFLFAKHYDGSFIIRVEDTDFERNIDGALESQFSNLDWLKITHDESYLKPNKIYGEYIQSKKIDRYYKLANQLIENGFAYKCYCSHEDLEIEKERQIENGVTAPLYSGKCRNISKKINDKEFSIRFKVPKNKEFIINDIVRNKIVFNSSEIGDFVIVKSNKVATYNFAVVVDDYDMKISHVIRGEEHISNTPKQLMIFEALSWNNPIFCHLTLIVDDSKKKLSKRSPNALFFIEEYKNKGYLPEAVFNYIALLGWSPKNEQEIYSIEELINIFTENNFSKSPSTFDMNKMKWFNSQWMKLIDEKKYLNEVKNFIDYERFNFDKKNALFNKILLLFKNEIDYFSQINNHLDIFTDNKKVDSETINFFEPFKTHSNEMIHTFLHELEIINDFSEDIIKSLIKNMGEKFSLKGKSLFMPIRMAVTKTWHGPELAKTILYIGKEASIRNVCNFIKEVWGGK
ncbi:glutamate--tRNA ligase [Spiroplasma endosymbiont of Aspidapion aeneum]|uniref:glutamate--tRNA ligase n=1 Tax=Spiroplasma endosymbiont of Aspidapion aeneum TaxID=3066276 RepID=UPI00313F1202